MSDDGSAVATATTTSGSDMGGSAEAVSTPTYAAPTESNSHVSSNEQPVPGQDKWYLSEGVEGQGDAPEWFKAGTFKDVASQAENYTKLQSHHNKLLGGFTGAPEGDYEYSLPQGLEEAGVELNTSDPYLKDFANYARESNMSQETFSGLIDQMQTYNHQAREANAEQVVQAINENVDQQLAAYGETNRTAFNEAVSMAGNLPNMTESGLNDVLDGITTADGLRAFVNIVNASRYSSVPQNAGQPSYQDHQSLMQRQAELQKLGGPARAAAQKALNADYAKMFPGNKVFGGGN